MSDTPEFTKIRALAQADRRVGACDTPEIARIRAALAAGPTPGPWNLEPLSAPKSQPMISANCGAKSPLVCVVEYARADQMRAYAAQAVEADRAARGVPDEMDAVAAQYAHKLALDLECVLADYSGTWWDAAIKTIGDYRSAMNAIHERESPTFMGEPLL